MELITEITLKSGRVIRADMGMLGICPNLSIAQSTPCAGELHAYTPDDSLPFDYEEPPLTFEEREEIADMMIERWKEWAGKVDWPEDLGA